MVVSAEREERERERERESREMRERERGEMRERRERERERAREREKRVESRGEQRERGEKLSCFIVKSFPALSTRLERPRLWCCPWALSFTAFIALVDDEWGLMLGTISWLYSVRKCFRQGQGGLACRSGQPLARPFCSSDGWGGRSAALLKCSGNSFSPNTQMRFAWHCVFLEGAARWGVSKKRQPQLLACVSWSKYGVGRHFYPKYIRISD